MKKTIHRYQQQDNIGVRILTKIESKHENVSTILSTLKTNKKIEHLSKETEGLNKNQIEMTITKLKKLKDSTEWRSQMKESVSWKIEQYKLPKLNNRENSEVKN